MKETRRKERGKNKKSKKNIKQPNKQKHRQMGIGAKRLGRVLQRLIIVRCYAYNM